MLDSDRQLLNTDKPTLYLYSHIFDESQQVILIRNSLLGKAHKRLSVSYYAGFNMRYLGLTNL